MSIRIPGRNVMRFLLFLLFVLALVSMRVASVRAQSDPVSPQPPQNGTIPAAPPLLLPDAAAQPAVQAAEANGSEFTGVLSVIHSDNFETGEYTVDYALVLDDGSQIALEFDPAMTPSDSPPAHLMGARVVVTGVLGASAAASSTGSTLLAQSIRPFGEVTAASTGATGTVRYANLLCLFPDTGIDPSSTPAEIAALFDRSADSIPTFFNNSSYGTLNIEFTTVTAWRTMPVNAADYPTDLDRAYAAASHCPDLFLDQIDLSTFDGVQFFINDYWAAVAGRGGGGSVTWNGKTKWMKATWYVSWRPRTIQHEIGHSLGMPHTDNSDGDGWTYDGMWDIMSGGDDDFAALHKARQGWIPPEKVFELGNESSVVVELSLQHLAGSRDRAGLISIGTGEDGPVFTVEAQAYPEPAYLRDPPGMLRGVLIFAVESYDFNTKIPQIGAFTDMGGLYGPGALRTGDLYVNRAHKFFVEVLQETAESTVVRVGRLNSVPAPPMADLQLSMTPVTNLPGKAAFEIKIANTGSATARNVYVEMGGTYKYIAWNGNEYTGYYYPLPDSPTAGWRCGGVGVQTHCTVARIAAGATARIVVSSIAQVQSAYTFGGTAFMVAEEATMSNNSAKAVGTFSFAPDLSVSLAIKPYWFDDDFIEIQAIVENEGYLETGATVAITLPVGLVNHTEDFDGNGVACATTGRVTRCTIATLPSGSEYMVRILVTERTESPPGSYTVAAKVWTTPALSEVGLANNSARAIYCTNCNLPYYLPTIVKR